MEKITEKDWEKVMALACDIANTDDPPIERAARKRYFNYMRTLLKKYGEQPQILASTADFYTSGKRAIPLLEKAYQLAVEENNAYEKTLIADSILNRLAESIKPDHSEVRKWLDILEQNLKDHPDKHIKANFKRISSDFR